MHETALGLVVAFYLWVRSYSERAFLERGWVFDKLTSAPPRRVSEREALAFVIGVNATGVLGWIEQLRAVLPLDGSTVSRVFLGWLLVSLCIHVAAAVWLQRMFRRAGAHGAQGDRRGDATSSLAATPGAVVDAAHRG